MAWRTLLLGLAFVESVSAILLERGLYFYTNEQLAFSTSANLWLALLHGATYAVSAFGGHRWSVRLGERRSLAYLLSALFVTHLLLARWTDATSLFVGFTLLGWLQGAKWPLIESFVGAGLGAREQARALGRFNLAWASAVPLALIAAGPLIASSRPELLFLLAAGLNLAALVLLVALPATPPHGLTAAETRASSSLVPSYARLLASGRWSMLSSYVLLFLLAPLMPQIFQALGHGVRAATFWSSWLDTVRLGTFAILTFSVGWHGARAPLLLAAVGLPLGCGLVLTGHSLLPVLIGEVLFGACAGIAYFASLYYGMLLKNAAVHAAGAHEGLIGLGFALGPAAGLVSAAFARTNLGTNLGQLLGTTAGALGAMAPLATVCLGGALWPLRQQAKVLK